MVMQRARSLLSPRTLGNLNLRKGLRTAHSLRGGGNEASVKVLSFLRLYYKRSLVGD